MTAASVRVGAEQAAGGWADADPFSLAGDDARIAFWLNVYNEVVTREMGGGRRTGTLLRHRGMFRRMTFAVGGFDYTLDVIEHGLLRGNARPPYSLRKILRAGDPRLAAAPSKPDPRIHFALNCGARSCPPRRRYEAAGLDSQLELATRGYLEAECDFDREGGAVVLPGLMKLYRSDFGSKEEQIEFAAAHLPEQTDWLRQNGRGLRLGYSRFDWTIVPAG